MKIQLLVTLILSLFLSCKRHSENKAQTENTQNTNKQAKSIGLTSYCFYELDEKYSTENDSVIINKWLIEKSDLILSNQSTENIFNHNGGGPNGAEWNPSTNLYVAILSSSKSENSGDTPKLYINGKMYKEKYLEFEPNLIWYRIKQEFWENKSRAISTTDIKKMYPTEFVDSVNAGYIQPITALNYGKILKFEISYKGDALINFFHVTYGE